MLNRIFKSRPALDQNASTETIMAVIAQDYLKEQRSKRRRRWLVLALVGLYIGVTAYVFRAQTPTAPTTPHVALVELHGTIGLESGVLARDMNRSLKRAFESEQSQGVLLWVNSPGGTPVQSAEISEQISRLRTQYPGKAIHTVISDICASGGYFIAAATDKIFANRSSIVGSIGVRMDSFGFVDAMQRLGVERRTLTAGNNKALLDPFSPVDEQQKVHTQTMLNHVHQHFIEVVKNGRGERLDESADLFSGLVWSGTDALRLGLIDDFGDVQSVAKAEFDNDTIHDYSPRTAVWEQFTRSFGVAVGKGLATVLTPDFQLR